MKRLLKLFLKLILILFLTILTQVGGIIYLISEVIFFKNTSHYRIKKLGFFLALYVSCTFVLIPVISPLFGREKTVNNDLIEPCTILTIICNRNYVTPQLNTSLQKIAETLNKKHPGIKLVYLDANFPFINGFPLPPHLSHNDGKKIDISFIYTNQKGELTNKKPAVIGYGIYEDPTPKEFNQIKACKERGYWQYDFAKYLTFGIRNNQLKLSEKATKDLLLAIVREKLVKKVFIEPHLRNRLGVQSTKIRFHGCQAVRHDDHIHLQLK